MRDRYFTLIDQLIQATLQGQIRSKEQVYQRLQAEIESGSGELFERCLADCTAALQPDLSSEDDLKQAKALRQQRALKTIQGEWERWQKANQANAAVSQQLADIIASQDNRLIKLLAALDPNQAQPITRDQIPTLIDQLEQQANTAADAAILLDLATGLQQGLKTWQQLETQLVSWLYEQNRAIGFGAPGSQTGPWQSWAKVVHGLPSQVFTDLAQHQALTEAGLPVPVSTQSWVELAFVLQRLQLGLVKWFDRQPYDPKAGKRLSIATFLTFTVVWSQLSQRLKQLQQETLATGSFQMALQVLRQFTQQDYFPLYGGLFAALSGESLQSMLDYLDQPLRQAPNTAAKARILTLLGYSQRALGRYQRALTFHQEALEIARQADDQPCEIANLNHISRTQVMQKDYQAAVDMGQRALILARQQGDRLGEANALANYGYSEVFQAQQQLETERYESILNHLQRGLKLSEQLGDLPSQALCANSLGIAQIELGDPQAAIESLRQGLYLAQNLGDGFLQGMNYAYLAEAYRQIDNFEKAIATGCLGMYLLHQINAQQWQYPASILNILYGQLGPDPFQQILSTFRPQLMQQIGTDGYDYLPKLLLLYRQSLN
jgi:tetratricopeptide (TPR) repeat protein